MSVRTMLLFPSQVILMPLSDYAIFVILMAFSDYGRREERRAEGTECI